MFYNNDYTKMLAPVDFDRGWLRSVEDMKKNVERVVEQVHKNAATSFPAYNIRKNGENKFTIEIAAAGLDLGAFDITLDKDILSIKCTPEKQDPKNFLHQGLSYKNWMREFMLNDGVEIKNASLINGLLKIELEKYLKETDAPKKINIETPSSKKQRQVLNENSDM